jgi:alpha-ribazole phosphatase
MTGFLLHLMRHGAPDLPGLLHGHGDAMPTQAGIDACVARAIPLAPAVLVTSDLSRAARPAIAIGQRLSLAPRIDPRWRELDFGDWDGVATATLDAAALAAFWADPDACPPPQGERWSAVLARIAAALADLEPRDTVILTHGGAMRAALVHLCGLTLAQSWAFDLPYGALLTLRVWPGAPPSAQIAGLAS